MKLVLKGAVAALAVLSAVPAVAQPYRPPPPGAEAPGMPPQGGWDIDRRINWMQERIERGRSDGSLDRHEARRVQMGLDRIRDDATRLRDRHGGRLWDRDRDMLQGRLDHLNDQIRWLRHNDERRPW